MKQFWCSTYIYPAVIMPFVCSYLSLQSALVPPSPPISPKCCWYLPQELVLCHIKPPCVEKHPYRASVHLSCVRNREASGRGAHSGTTESVENRWFYLLTAACMFHLQDSGSDHNQQHRCLNVRSIFLKQQQNKCQKCLQSVSNKCLVLYPVWEICCCLCHVSLQY